MSFSRCPVRGTSAASGDADADRLQAGRSRQQRTANIPRSASPVAEPVGSAPREPVLPAETAGVGRMRPSRSAMIGAGGWQRSWASGRHDPPAVREPALQQNPCSTRRRTPPHQSPIAARYPTPTRRCAPSMKPTAPTSSDAARGSRRQSHGWGAGVRLLVQHPIGNGTGRDGCTSTASSARLRTSRRRTALDVARWRGGRPGSNARWSYPTDSAITVTMCGCSDRRARA
jgi:hypothetical protein